MWIDFFSSEFCPVLQKSAVVINDWRLETEYIWTHCHIGRFSEIIEI